MEINQFEQRVAAFDTLETATRLLRAAAIRPLLPVAPCWANDRYAIVTGHRRGKHPHARGKDLVDHSRSSERRPASL